MAQASSASRKRYWKSFILRFWGNYLILVSLFFIIKTFYDPLLSEIQYFVDTKLIQKTYVVDSNDEQWESIPVIDRPNQQPKSQFARLFNLKNVETIQPADPNFSVVIPKIAANARIISNVNPADEAEYLDKLQYGVAHASGTYFPGQSGHIFLFAHSTDYVWNIGTYNAIFYLLYKLQEGDEINVFFEGKRHVYLVTGKKVVESNEIEYLTRKTPTEFLTLQTCWPPGTTLKRLLVFAEPKVM